MRNHIFARGLLTALAIVLAQPADRASAEVIEKISVGTTYDTNAYGSYAREADAITHIGIYLANRSSGEHSMFEYYYSGNGNIFAQSGNRSFVVNRVGVAYARELGGGRNNIVAGASVAVRLDRSYYNVYDYLGGQLAVNGKWYTAPTVLIRLGYRLRLRDYWNLDLLNYAEHRLSAQVSKFLPSRTTVRGDIAFGYRNNRNPRVESLDTGFGPFRPGRGRPVPVTVDPGVPDESQVVLGVQVAQSLFENTGLSLRYQARLNTSSDTYYLAGEESGYSDDVDLFNDRYDYEGHEWSAKLTQQLPLRLRLVLEGGYEIRSYDGREALDVDGNAIAEGLFREDRETFASVTLEQPLTSRLDMGIWYGYQRNLSNDLYYNYGARHSLSVDLKLGF
ncbi:MAG: hypothetical protein QGI83_16020 [Candidatus Latescibacteria bacterium]|jgi:hypothetical protein|nr:hypothetical protein [Candidatus Latescibacterota bacterium]